MEGKQREPIRLGEDDLRNAREVWGQLEENFRSLSAIAQRALGQDTEAYAASQKTGSSKEFFIFSRVLLSRFTAIRLAARATR